MCNKISHATKQGGVTYSAASSAMTRWRCQIRVAHFFTHFFLCFTMTNVDIMLSQSAAIVFIEPSSARR